MKRKIEITILAALAWCLGAALDSSAATLVVTNLANSGPGTLRDAVAFASTNAGGAVITFGPSLDGQVIFVQSELVLSNQVTVDASALTNGITLSANRGEDGFFPPTNRVFEVAANTVAELDKLTIQGGAAASVGTYLFAAVGQANGGGVPGGCGGGILVNPNAGTLTLNYCTVSGNFAEYDGGAIALAGGVVSTPTVTLNHCAISNNVALYGGGIFIREGTVTVNNSTISANTAGVDGGGFYNYGGNATLDRSTVCNNYAVRQGGGIFNGSTFAVNNSTIFANSAASGGGIWDDTVIYLNNSTFSGNAAVLAGGGVREFRGTAFLTNTIVAGNTARTNANASGIAAGTVSAFHSLTSGNPLLALPGNYGGPTLTMPPLPGSPALDAGDDSVTNFLATDARGYPRLSGAHVDIGAVEFQVVSAANAPVLMNLVGQANGALMFGFTSSPDASFTVLASTNVALPLSQWSILGAPVQDPPGQYTFTDWAATNYPRRFYRVVGR